VLHTTLHLLEQVYCADEIKNQTIPHNLCKLVLACNGLLILVKDDQC
jgi:hypothetical protein